MAKLPVLAPTADTAEPQGRRFLGQLLPGIGKGPARQLCPGLGHHAAGGQKAVPGDPEGRTSGPASDSPVDGVVAPLLQSRRLGAAALYPLEEAICGLAALEQLDPPDPVTGRFLRREPVVDADGVVVPSDGWEHIGGQIQPQVQFLGIGGDGFEIGCIVGRQGAVELHGDPGGLQAPDRPVHPVEDTLHAAKALVCLVTAAVEGDVHPTGRPASEARDGLVVQETAVGVDSHQHAHVHQLRVKLPESGPQQRLAAGQQQEEQSLLPALPGDPEPVVVSKHGPVMGLHLGGGPADVAHPAGKIAKGRQLEGAA